MSDNGPFDCFNRNGYDHGFCECYRDPICCLSTCFCPCLVVGKVKADLDGTSFDILSCLCTVLGAYRNRRRIQGLYNHLESEDGSMLGVTCCWCCAITQDAHEESYRKAHGEVPAEAAPAAVDMPK